ncbi:PPE domain-containing protein [Actinokineospora sp. NBRC 105648]|uniref:PPE domain-containing protein n=1 Tax=Actinokineospora sp. NBRC 105648 TaxID=3032206 RepID=UPI0024A56F83|nr:PPE domain-containing protein [Actinokineospora sp. NBRC 105648]GLZ37595.1 hypothetical protein Acsp05_12200 [Actinokineospora sp. NBRC 105648]
MAGDNGLADLRFEGYGYEALAQQLDRLRQGPGSSSIFRAVRALMDIADGLSDTDRTLREELAKIGVEWQGAAADRGEEATKNSSIYASDAVPVVANSAGGVSEQGHTFSATAGSAPQGQELRGANQMGWIDAGLSAVGVTTPRAAEVQRTQAAHDAAAAAMNDYARNSQGALGNYQNLPVPPNLNLVSQPTQTHGMTAAQGFSTGEGAYTPTGAGTAPGGPSATGVPGGQPGSFSGVNPGAPGTTGGLGPTGTPSFTGPGRPAEGLNIPALGRSSGVGPVLPGMGGLPNTGAGFGGVRPGFPGALMGEIATAAGIAGAGGAGVGAGASLEKDKVVRGGGNEGAAAKRGAPGNEGAKRSGLSPVADMPDEEARAARNAERLGTGKSGRPGSSLLQPAAAGAGAEGEEDDEHVRKYGIDSDDVFGDDRLVVSPVLGQDEDA